MPLGETIGHAYIKIHADGSGFDEEVRGEVAKAGPEFEKGGEDSSNKFWSRFRGASNKNRKRSLDDLKQDLNKFGTGITKVGNAFGKAFGRGSRNDFLNLVGSIVSAIPRAIGALVTWISQLNVFDKVLADAEGNLNFFGEAVASLSQFIGPIGQLIATVGAIQLIAGTLGALGSGVVLLTGLILALAGSIGFALMGAIVAVGGALVPFAAGLGVAMVALQGINKIGGKNLKALKSDFDDLAKSVARDIFGKNLQGLGAIRSVLAAVRPVIDAVASSIGGLIQGLGEASKSKGFQNLMRDIAAAIGPMVTLLGQIGGNIALFFGEAFVAAAPMVQELLGWILGLTQALVDSGKAGKGGKSPLQKFFEDAWDSAKKVGSFIVEIIGLVGDLLGIGRETGDNIFVKMTDWVRRIRDWLADPANQKTLQQWVRDAETLADKIGDLVTNVGEFIAALDTPENRKIFLTMIDAVNLLLDALTKVADEGGKLNQKIFEENAPDKGTFGQRVKDLFTDLPTQIGQAFSGLWGQISPFITAIPGQIVAFFAPIPGQIAGFFVGLGMKIWTAAGNLASDFGTWVSGVIAAAGNLINQIVTFFVGLPGKIFAAAGSLASAFGSWVAGLPVQIITLVGNIVVGFNDLAGRAILAAGDIIGKFTQWLADLPGKALQAVVNITVAFLNLGIKIIQNAGNLASQFATWVSSLPGKARKLASDIIAGLRNLGARIIAGAGNLAARFGAWVQSLPGRARTLASQIISGLANLASRMIQRAGNLAVAFGNWVRSLPGKARQIANDIANGFNDLAGKAIRKAGSIVAKIREWASGVGAAASGVADDIVNSFRGLAGRIIDAIGTIVPHFRMPTITVPKINLGASGFITNGPRLSVIGEAGPEAVVPLNRNLSQVDPAVRALSAIAQGKIPGLARGGVSGGKTIDIGGITINTPTADPRAVASEVVAHMAAATYL